MRRLRRGFQCSEKTPPKFQMFGKIFTTETVARKSRTQKLEPQEVVRSREGMRKGGCSNRGLTVGILAMRNFYD